MPRWKGCRRHNDIGIEAYRSDDLADCGLQLVVLHTSVHVGREHVDDAFRRVVAQDHVGEFLLDIAELDQFLAERDTRIQMLDLK